MKRAWYLGHAREEVGDRAILVGDPARVDRLAALLDEPRLLPVSRGLRTATGGYGGRSVSVVAFGMGAPIATIVLHELADLGVSTFLRIGTAMHFAPARAGDLIVSEAGIGFEGTSPSYRAEGGPFGADARLVAAMRSVARCAGLTAAAGTFASFDAFYRDMFGIDAEGRERAGANRRMLRERGVIAVDMETSALLAAAGALGVAFASLCLGTVDAISQEKLATDKLAEGEAGMFRVALDGLARLDGGTAPQGAVRSASGKPPRAG